jgi:predicted nucleotidyltransferase component of viral defense system
MIHGLSQPTETVFEQVSLLNCITGYTLIGGTALALQLHHRLSEDLDFCKWKTKTGERIIVDWSLIERELSQIGDIKKDLLGDNQCNFILNDHVKLSFYGNNMFKEPEGLHKMPFLNRLSIADVETVGVLKMEVMSRRRTFRDYYDMYVILESGVPLGNILAGTGKYTRHGLNTKNMLSILNNTENITEDTSFKHLNPAHDTDLNVMREVVRGKIAEFLSNTSKQKKAFRRDI